MLQNKYLLIKCITFLTLMFSSCVPNVAELLIGEKVNNFEGVTFPSFVKLLEHANALSLEAKHNKMSSYRFNQLRKLEKLS